MRIRQSTLGNADICLRRMQYDLETPRDVYHSGVVRAIGTAYHAGLENYYQNRMDLGFDKALNVGLHLEMAYWTFDSEVEKAGEHFIWTEKFPDKASAYVVIKLMVEAYFNGHYYWPEDWEVLAVEHTFVLPFDMGHTRTGTMDLILGNQDYVYGDDHKTAGRMWDQYKHLPRKNNQAGFYTAALKELYPDAEGWGFVFDVMTYAGKFERRVSNPTNEHIDAILAKALQVGSLYDTMRGMNIDLPTNPSSTLCSQQYCDFWDICPSGAALA